MLRPGPAATAAAANAAAPSSAAARRAGSSSFGAGRRGRLCGRERWAGLLREGCPGASPRLPSPPRARLRSAPRRPGPPRRGRGAGAGPAARRAGGRGGEGKEGRESRGGGEAGRRAAPSRAEPPRSLASPPGRPAGPAPPRGTGVRAPGPPPGSPARDGAGVRQELAVSLTKSPPGVGTAPRFGRPCPPRCAPRQVGRAGGVLGWQKAVLFQIFVGKGGYGRCQRPIFALSVGCLWEVCVRVGVRPMAASTGKGTFTKFSKPRPLL